MRILVAIDQWFPDRQAGSARLAAASAAGLAARGHDVQVIEDWSWIVGGGHGIMIDPETGVLMGGADPRRDGYAMGW